MRERSRSPNEGALLHAILDHATRQPNAPALIVGEGRLTWLDLAERVLAYGGMVRDAVAERGGRVAILGANSLDHVVSYLAIVAAGRCAVPLPLSARPGVLSGMLADCAPDLVLFDEAGEAALGAAPGTASMRLGSAPTTRPLEAAVEAAPEAAFNIIYSSGTTGRPKGIVQPHMMRFRQSTRRAFGLGPDAVMLLATPLCSNTTLMPLLATLAHGGCVVLMTGFDAACYLDLAERLRATHTMLVPVQYRRILAVPEFTARELSAFRVKQSTGAPMDAETRRRASREWPGKLLEIYGLTEGGCTCILDHEAEPDKDGTVGRPAPGCEVRIVDEFGRAVPRGETGEIVGRSPMMMSG
ncbi:MAG: AMP-binding protein, partial [Alphaproteobacteria bacterium]|nr:AMP-binding protein [Alphaproteobacteria bacterium]